MKALARNRRWPLGEFNGPPQEVGGEVTGGLRGASAVELKKLGGERGRVRPKELVEAGGGRNWRRWCAGGLCGRRSESWSERLGRGVLGGRGGEVVEMVSWVLKRGREREGTVSD
ncbi:uncharacterized protein A4U43_C01F18220 [Asparagus officinalis]|uniref:Uncharacterized protein n=1 Tax=Asparagus officinalis TaxID=4686 RepID=A0A5P1FQW5_ASPOF|nr:uncharacterized protein A4U43_C01F18220 [Asparagus officinalis]